MILVWEGVFVSFANYSLHSLIDSHCVLAALVGSTAVGQSLRRSARPSVWLQTFRYSLAWRR
jgi:hypothetical protein